MNLEKLAKKEYNEKIYCIGQYNLFMANRKLFLDNVEFIEHTAIQELSSKSDFIIVICGQTPIETYEILGKKKYQHILLSDLIDLKTKAFWDSKKGYAGIDKNHYLSNETFVEILERDQCWRNRIKNFSCKRGKIRVLSLGCGTGRLENILLAISPNMEIDAIDISEDSLNEARERSKILGTTSKINYSYGNLNKDIFSKKYDLIIAQECMHHILNLEFAYSNIRNSLYHDGLFIQLEYIGTNRFQWDDLQLGEINFILRHLPKKYKIKPEYKKQSLFDIINADPSEAIRAEEIVNLTKYFFRNVEVRYQHGTIMHILYQCLNYQYFHTENHKPLSNRIRSNILSYLVIFLENRLKKIGYADFAVIFASNNPCL